ncbi:hypothetical protein C1X65_22670 [Pseudomonas sp. FW305-70]|nr:hypothetical protein C1X65_22670 [Pseudomonas sp. FW305-70]
MLRLLGRYLVRRGYRQLRALWKFEGFVICLVEGIVRTTFLISTLVVNIPLTVFFLADGVAVGI